jgi:hypothetical protein
LTLGEPFACESAVAEDGAVASGVDAELFVGEVVVEVVEAVVIADVEAACVEVVEFAVTVVGQFVETEDAADAAFGAAAVDRVVADAVVESVAAQFVVGDVNGIAVGSVFEPVAEVEPDPVSIQTSAAVVTVEVAAAFVAAVVAFAVAAIAAVVEAALVAAAN